MRKSEICRLLSEKLEPLSGIAAEKRYRCGPWTFWKPDQVQASRGRHELEPVNYFESEDASAKLLEAMPSMVIANFGPVGWHAFQATDWFVGNRSGPIQGEYWGIRTGPGVESIIYANDRDRKTAIALAACKWLGIEGEISE